MNRARTAAVAGGVLTLLAAAGLIAAGYHYDYTGGGPSPPLTWLLWGSLLVGLLLLGVAAVQAIRADLPRR